MLLLTLLLPPLIISLPQTISKLQHLPSHISSLIHQLRHTDSPVSTETPTITPGSNPLLISPIPDSSSPLTGDDDAWNFYRPIIRGGHQGWVEMLSAVDSWESYVIPATTTGAESVGNEPEVVDVEEKQEELSSVQDDEHVWFIWFSRPKLDKAWNGEQAPAAEHWPRWSPLFVEEEGGESEAEGGKGGTSIDYELNRRKIESGAFDEDEKNPDVVYRNTAVQVELEQHLREKEERLGIKKATSSSLFTSSSSSRFSSLVSGTKTTTLQDPTLFASETPIAPPPARAHFVFANCGLGEDAPLCRRFLAIDQHLPMLYVVTRNVTIKLPSQHKADPEVAPLVPTGAGHEDTGMEEQVGDNVIVNLAEETDEVTSAAGKKDEDLPIIPSSYSTGPTHHFKYILRRVPLKENLTTTDLHNFYEFRRWEKLSVWDDVLNPIDGVVSTALEGKVGEWVGIAYQAWYYTPKWAVGLFLGLMLRWITVAIIERGQQKRAKHTAKRLEKKKKAALDAGAEVPKIEAPKTKAQMDTPVVPTKVATNGSIRMPPEILAEVNTRDVSNPPKVDETPASVKEEVPEYSKVEEVPENTKVEEVPQDPEVEEVPQKPKVEKASEERKVEGAQEKPEVEEAAEYIEVEEVSEMPKVEVPPGDSTPTEATSDVRAGEAEVPLEVKGSAAEVPQEAILLSEGVRPSTESMEEVKASN